MSRGSDITHVERLDIGGMVEHVAQLFGETVDLGVGQVEPGQPGDVNHLVAGDAFGHGAKG